MDISPDFGVEKTRNGKCLVFPLNFGKPGGPLMGYFS